MGKANVITKQYLQDNTRFADVCNFYLFDGREVIKPGDLQEKDVIELALPEEMEKIEAVEKIRDILKACCVKTAKGITYLVIGIENQADTHYAMVVRNMLYDALNYSSQVRACAKVHRENNDLSGAEFLSGFSKEDRLIPVITLTIYWNAGTWDGARCLHDMLEVKEQQLLRYIPNYRLNLIVPGEIEDFAAFKTELGAIFDFISCSDSGTVLKNAIATRGEKWSHLSKEGIQLLNSCFDAKINEDIEGDLQKGDGDVCKAIKEIEAMSEARGMEIGKEIGKEMGEERLSRLINMLCVEKKYEEIQNVTSNAKIREEYYTLYNL